VQNSGVTPELKSLKKRAPANKNHKVKAEKKKVVGFSERCFLIASVCESGAGAKDFVANFCAEETETIIRGKNAHCSTTHGMLRIARAGGRAGGQVVLGAVFFLAKYRQKAKFKIKFSKKN